MVNPIIPIQGIHTSNTGESDLILAWTVELVGLAALTLFAGLSDGAGNIGLIVIVGLWLLFMMTHQTDLQVVPNLFNYLQSKGL